ncbi:type IV pili methyl-accepting chemotaxis transducer N-terminal domain-containing protein, partial [Escherichia coli]|nr:type IV pili methyl-accepting chemotaxis transducer N-terminal domain-containing protein [Escherichia coli]
MIVKRPVSASLARAFFYIVLLSILSTGIALLTLASSLRDAEAINIAGSLRMQSYRLGYDLQSGSPQLNAGNDSNLLIVFYVQIMPDDFVMQLH